VSLLRILHFSCRVGDPRTFSYSIAQLSGRNKGVVPMHPPRHGHGTAFPPHTVSYLRKGAFFMLFWMHALFLMLRVQGVGGSFPRPLRASEEQEFLARMAQGDAAARDALIEHNLRLV